MLERTASPGQGGAELAPTDQFEALARNMVRLFEQGTKAFSKLTERLGTNDQGPYSLSSEQPLVVIPRNLAGNQNCLWIAGHRVL